MRRRIILLNGPPRSGKDAAATLLLASLTEFPTAHVKFAEPLRNAVPALFGLSQARWMDLYTNNKELPVTALFGHSARSAMIWVSESVMKPHFGPTVFGRLAVNQIDALAENVVVISDCGFTAELDPLIEVYGTGSLLIVQLHRSGHTFDGDSRSYIDRPDLETRVLANNATLDELGIMLDAAVRPWLTHREE